MKKILISTISFVNDKKNGSDIYTTFVKRLIDDVINKTSYDIMVTTNKIEYFQDIISLNSDRIILREERLENHKTHVGAFNQLLKFYAFKNVDEKYDWVWYLDCDAGLTDTLNENQIEKQLDDWEQKGYDMIGLLYQRTYEWAEKEYQHTIENKTHKKLFDDKFKFYGINPEWRKAYLPSEHILLFKNNEKLNVMCNEFEKFCFKFETQDETYPVTFDMEAFEIGVSALIAGYNAGEMGWPTHCDVLKVSFNGNNWEKIKR